MSFAEVLEDHYILQRSHVYAYGCTWQFIQSGVLSWSVMVVPWLDDVGGGWCVWHMVGIPVEGL